LLEGRGLVAFGYVAATLLVGLSATLAGLRLGRRAARVSR
jgi:fluoride ion exporter CrcB/FEX